MKQHLRFTMVLPALLNRQANAFVAPIPSVVRLSHQPTRLTLFPDFASSFSIADGVSAATYLKPDAEISGALSNLTIRTGSPGYFDTVGAPKGLPVAVLVAVLVSTFTSRHNQADHLVIRHNMHLTDDVR